MRFALTLVLVIAAGFVAAGGQQAMDPKLHGQLKQLFPESASFTPKGGNPPHFKALGAATGADKAPVLGFAFWTTELEPLERAYDGPIKMLVGLDAKGVLAGVVVVDHREPYGYFSVDLPRFPAQFKGKDIRDPFRVGGDIDAISRATISITSATRAIKNSARRVAKALIPAPPGPTK
jgi:NosR/NirI family nitrous oxide reductase transcriptional regulator